MGVVINIHEPFKIWVNDGVMAGGGSTKAKDQCKLLHTHKDAGSLCFIAQALCKRVCEGDEWKCVFKHMCQSWRHIKAH